MHRKRKNCITILDEEKLKKYYEVVILVRISSWGKIVLGHRFLCALFLCGFYVVKCRKWELYKVIMQMKADLIKNKFQGIKYGMVMSEGEK